MSTVTSQDGTRIAYTKQGAGPTLILVSGALNDGSENTPLAEVLAETFTVVNYSRRGRPPCGDTAPYDIRREIEDLAALGTTAAGGPLHLYGVSSGGALALEAAAAGLPVARVAVYEVPYQVGAEALGRWKEHVAALAGASEPGEMIALFMRLAGSSDDQIAEARRSPAWAQVEPIAHTLAYDAACLGSGPVPRQTLARVTQPTLVATGAVLDPHMGRLRPGFFDDAADLIVEHLPDAQRRVLEGQSHVADPQVVAPVLRTFFDAG
ncbi:MAG: alpha/beta fold hydrolase [Nocardioidaceae bacterium]